MNLVFLPESSNDLDRLYAFLIHSEATLKTADKALIRLKDGINALPSNPKLGLSLDDGTGRRELSLSFGKGAYIIRYIIDDEREEILILRIWHSKENRK